MSQITTPTIGQIINAEFIKPLGLSVHEVSQKTGVPLSTIQDILLGRKQMTVEDSVCLGKLFGVSDRYLLKMQHDIDSRNDKA